MYRFLGSLLKPILRLTLGLVLLFNVHGVEADKVDERGRAPIVIVTEAYPPFVFGQDDVVMGSDWEIVQAVFKEMGHTVELRFCPWKRCQFEIRADKADAILDISRTPEREKQMVFPDEPLSTAVTVLFKRSDDKVDYGSLKNLAGLTVGTELGYKYCPEVDNAPFRKENGKNLRINLNKLLHKRLDLILAIYPVASYTIQDMGIGNRVEHVTDIVFCEDEHNYLAFSKKGARQIDVSAFSKRLQHFKRTEKYRQIVAKYGITNANLVETHINMAPNLGPAEAVN